VSGTGNGNGSGVFAEGGASGPGVQGLGHGSQPGVAGTGGTTGCGGDFTAGGGAAPARGAVYLRPQNAPSAPADGDIWYDSGGSLKVRIAGVTRTVNVT
jgi:hypothetical protein